MRKFWFLKGFAMVAAFIFIGGFAVMSLWNWLIPSIFGLVTITWVQALGLLPCQRASGLRFPWRWWLGRWLWWKSPPLLETKNG